MINKLSKRIILLLVFTPIWGNIYLYLGIPKNIIVFYSFLFLILGLMKILKTKIIKKPLFLLPLFFYMIYVPLRNHYQVDIDRVFLTQLYYDTQFFVLFLTFIIIYNISFEKKDIRFIKKWSIFIIIIGLIVSIIQVFDYSFLRWNIELEKLERLNMYTIRRISIFGYYDVALGMSLMPLLAAIIGMKEIKGKLKILLLLSGGLIAMLSNARWVMIGWVICLFEYYWINKKKLSIKKTFKIATSLLIMSIILFNILIALGYDYERWVAERLFAEEKIENTTRYKAIANFLHFFPKYWLIGTGEHNAADVKWASNKVGSSQIHVGYLSHIISYGVVGSFFLYLFWLLLIKQLYKEAKRSDYWGGFFAFAIFLSANLTLVRVWSFTYGLILSLVLHRYYLYNKGCNDVQK